MQRGQTCLVMVSQPMVSTGSLSELTNNRGEIGSSIETLLNLSPGVVTRLWDHQKRLNNRDFPVDYTDKELATIGITDLDYPRIPRMVQSFSLEFWRGTAVLNFWRIWTEKMSEGAILADAVGLDKTIASRRESQH